MSRLLAYQTPIFISGDAARLDVVSPKHVPVNGQGLRHIGGPVITTVRRVPAPHSESLILRALDAGAVFAGARIYADDVAHFHE